MAKGNEVILYLMADNKDLKAKLSEAQGQIDKTQKKTETSSSRIGAAMGRLGGAIVAVIGVQAIRAFVNMAGQLDSVSRAYANLARNAEGGSQRLLAAMREASAGTIDDLNLMKTANLALQLMGEEVMTRLPEMATIARAAARATGQDVAFMLESLVVATGRQSIMVLDNLGISSAIAAQKMDEYAQSLGKTRDQLTAAEKKAAFFYAAMEAGNDLIRRTGMGALTLGERIQIMNANMKNFTTTVMTNMIPALSQLSHSLTKTGNSGSSTANKIGRAFGILIVVLTMAIESLGALGGTFTQMGQRMSAAWNSLIANVASGMARLQSLMGDTSGAAMWTGVMNDARAASEAANAESFTGLENYESRMEELAAELARLWEGGEEGAADTSAEIERLTGEIDQLTASAGNANAELNRGQYLRFIGDDLGAELAQLEEEFNKLFLLAQGSEERRLALSEAYAARRAEIELQHNVFLKTLQTEWTNAFANAYGAFESITKATLREVLFGKGGWKEWRAAMKEILQSLVIDLMYAIAKALLLRAIMAGIGGVGGGGFLGGVIGGALGAKLEKGYMPVYSSGHIPILANGAMPSDHFPAYIGTREAVINADSTKANYGLLAAMNQNPGAQVGAGEDGGDRVINLQVDGQTLFEITDRKRSDRARSMGTRDYMARSVYR